MGFFVVLLLVPMAIQHIAVKGYRYEKKNKLALAFYFVFLTVLVMLRHERIGSDTRNYMYYFGQYARMSWNSLTRDLTEVGFSVFNKLISLLTDDPRIYLVITAIVISAMIYPTYRRLCVDTSLTIVLFSTMSTFLMMFSGISQMLAIGLGFLAYEFTRRKLWLPFLVTVCLAMTFHTSAFMLIFMYPLYYAKITRKWLYVVVPLIAVVFALNSQIFGVLSVILEQYTEYDTSITYTGAYTMILVFAFFAVFSFLVPDESKMDAELIGLRNFLLFALVLQMFAPLHTLAMRMNYYYIIFIPLLMPKIIACKSRKWTQVAVLGRHMMVVFFFLYFFYNASAGGNLNVFPYHFFWENL